MKKHLHCTEAKHTHNKTDRLTRNSYQTHTPPYPSSGVATITFKFISITVSIVRTYFDFFLQDANVALVR